MIDQNRFGIVTTKSSKPELNALKYAVAMAGATAHEDSIEAAERCYNLARSNLEKAERGDTDEPFMTIAAVQSLVLIVYYELKKKTFTRTWMSVGRCMRLAKALGLDHMDRDADLDGTPTPVLARCNLPSTSDPTELEERRNTFWCAYIIDSYVSSRTGCANTFDPMEVSVSSQLSPALSLIPFCPDDLISPARFFRR